ncbi:hypothetical protein JHK87_018715 [Glycine soja]|nr:hypothetical protein JHK87_018715 [Glycine soja]KAG5038004.1 hypothetical protein JHK86_018844 [Glycine max]
MQEHESIEEMFTRFTTIVNELNALGENYTTHQRIKKILRTRNLKFLATDELIGSLKVHKQGLMDEMKLLKGKIITLKASQKTNIMHQSKALSSIEASDIENSDVEFSKEDEEELAFLTKRVKRLLRKRKGPRV